MATWELTPNQPNPITQLTEPFLGWQLTLATAMDLLTGCNIVFAAGWVPHLIILATSDPTFPIWQLILNKGSDQVVINDTDWLGFDGVNVWGIAQSDVAASYAVTQYTFPTPTGGS